MLARASVLVPVVPLPAGELARAAAQVKAPAPSVVALSVVTAQALAPGLPPTPVDSASPCAGDYSSVPCLARRLRAAVDAACLGHPPRRCRPQAEGLGQVRVCVRRRGMQGAEV